MIMIAMMIIKIAAVGKEDKNATDAKGGFSMAMQKATQARRATQATEQQPPSVYRNRKAVRQVLGSGNCDIGIPPNYTK